MCATATTQTDMGMSLGMEEEGNKGPVHAAPSFMYVVVWASCRMHWGGIRVIPVVILQPSCRVRTNVHG